MTEINLVKGQIRADGDFKDDILRGSVDNNILSGNGGNDQIWGGSGGNDTIIGGDGADGLWWDKNDSNDVIVYNGDASKDALICYESSYGNHTGYYTGSGDLVIGLNNNSNNITIANWQNTASNRRMQNFVFKENGMAVDYLWNAGQSCEVNLYDAEFSLSNVHKAICVDSASATMRGTAGADYLQGGSGNDQIWGGQSGVDTLSGGAGADQYWWGAGNSGNVTIKDDPSNFQDTLYLYNLTSREVQTTVFGTDLIISSGAGNNVTIENGANDKIGTIKFADGTTMTGDQLLSKASNGHHLNIKFDYSLDTNGWFNNDRRAALERSARAWTDHIIADMPNVGAGTKISIADVTSYQARDYYGNGQISFIPKGSKEVITSSETDDMLIYVGSYANPNNDNDSASASAGSQFSAITFNTASSQNYDYFEKIATHEIGHILGINESNPNFRAMESIMDNQYFFNGENSKALNGGAPIQMVDSNHPNNYDVSSVMGYGPNVSSVTNMDLAMIKDIGWSVV